MEDVYPVSGAYCTKEMSVIYKNRGALDFYGSISLHVESFSRTGAHRKFYLALWRLPCEISLSATLSLEPLERVLETCQAKGFSK